MRKKPKTEHSLQYQMGLIRLIGLSCKIAPDDKKAQELRHIIIMTMMGEEKEKGET